MQGECKQGQESNKAVRCLVAVIKGFEDESVDNERLSSDQSLPSIIRKARIKTSSYHNLLACTPTRQSTYTQFTVHRPVCVIKGCGPDTDEELPWKQAAALKHTHSATTNRSFAKFRCWPQLKSTLPQRHTVPVLYNTRKPELLFKLGITQTGQT